MKITYWIASVLRRGRWRGSPLVMALLLGVLTFGGAEVRGEKPVAREYDVKAVFLLNFAQYVEWPNTAFAGPDSPVIIGVVGADPFGPILDQAVEGETVHGHKVIVKRSAKIEDLVPCHILFVCRSEQAKLNDILSVVKGAGVLTVSEMEGFALQGGIVNFFLDGKKVRFEVNLNAARCGGVKISSQLLCLARIVGQGQQ